MRPQFKGKGLRILDFDCEARPLSWYGGEFVTKELTAIACAFTPVKATSAVRIECWLLGTPEQQAKYPDIVSGPEMLANFVERYNEADLVTGHYIRGYDLPVINGALLEFGLPLLGDKLAQDTKTDLVKRSGLSVSMENLGALLDLKHEKVQMDQAKWRSANRLEFAGIMQTKKRVIGDVREHIEMRAKLLELGALRAPSVWSGTSTGAVPKYHA